MEKIRWWRSKKWPRKITLVFFLLGLFLLAAPNLQAALSDNITDISGHPFEAELRALIDNGMMPLAEGQTMVNPDALILTEQLIDMYVRVS